MEKFENKIIDMRDMYEERKEKGLPMMVQDEEDYVVNLEAVCCMPSFLFFLFRFYRITVFSVFRTYKWLIYIYGNSIYKKSCVFICFLNRESHTITNTFIHKHNIK